MCDQLVHLESVCEAGAVLRLVPGVGRLLLDLARRTQHLLAPGLPQPRGTPPAHVTRDIRHVTYRLYLAVLRASLGCRWVENLLCCPRLSRPSSAIIWELRRLQCEVLLTAAGGK